MAHKNKKFHTKSKGIFKKKIIVEAIWSKVDNLISKIMNIFPAASTKMGPSGDTDFRHELHTIP